jgi:hypothetical protein
LLSSYSKEKQKAIKESEVAALCIEDGQIRYRVKSRLWLESSIGFESFIESLIKMKGEISKSGSI